MSVPGGSKGGAKTCHQSGTNLGELVGPGKEFVLSEVPTLRAIIQKGILIKEMLMIEEMTSKKNILVCRWPRWSLLSGRDPMPSLSLW